MNFRLVCFVARLAGGHANRLTLRFAAVVLASTLIFASSAAAQEYKAAVTSAPVPAEISSAIRASLSPTGIAVTGPSGPVCEIWTRAAIPAAKTPSNALGVSYGTLVDGSLFGAIHFDSAVHDFRNQPIKAGTYVLRYALQPVDGNHQGVSDYRDFLLLTPPTQDTQTANLADNDLYNLSRKASGSGHPSVWSLVPVDSAPTLLPGVKHDTNEDFWIVYFKAAVGNSPQTIGLVFLGHAAEQ